MLSLSASLSVLESDLADQSKTAVAAVVVQCLSATVSNYTIHYTIGAAGGA